MSEVKALHIPEDGEIFSVGGIEFIKFPEKDGLIPAVTRKTIFNSEFGENNDFSKSTVLDRLVDEFLPKIIAAVGENGISPITTDLTTLDGLKPYPAFSSLVSLPTFDFYRQNVSVFDKYKVDEWWWLATPESAQPHCEPWWTVCVSPSGGINFGDFNYDCGVRPFCIFKSSIFESLTYEDGR